MDPSERQKQSGLPHTYRNREGAKEEPTHTFQPWETRRVDRLQEFVTKRPDEERFDYMKRTVPLHKMQQPVHPKDRAKHMKKGRNTPGDLRAIADGNKRLQGVNYHPEGDPSGFKRAPLEPMDREGRMMKNRHNDRVNARPTWPPR